MSSVRTPEAAEIPAGISSEVVLVGGGLANGLIALRLSQLRPELRVLVLEQGDTLGGNHTWSFHSSDLEAGQLEWISPLISRTWHGHSVRFPRLERELKGTYHSVRSERFHEVLSSVLGHRAQLNCRVEELGASRVRISGGAIRSRCVIDGRGLVPDGEAGGAGAAAGYQKFVGLDVTLEEGHGLTRPVLMDARVEQKDGFRFIYLLPWTERSLLIEDTRYSESPRLPVEELKDEIHRYASLQGWRFARIDRVETGVLPIPMRVGVEPSAAPSEAARVGMRGGLFHATTSYSMPYAVRFADAVARLPELSTETVAALARRHRDEAIRKGAFFRLLNRMLFLAAKPEQRYRVLQRFYGLPEPLIERFYAGSLNGFDQLRILSGRPPVPLGRAIRSALFA